MRPQPILLLLITGLQLACGANARDPAQAGDGSVHALTGQLALLTRQQLDEWARMEAEKTAQVQRALATEEDRRRQCADGLQQAQTLRTTLSELVTVLQDTARRHAALVAAVQSYGTEQARWQTQATQAMRAQTARLAAVDSVAAYEAAERQLDADLAAPATGPMDERRLAELTDAVRQQLERAQQAVHNLNRALTQMRGSSNLCVNLAAAVRQAAARQGLSADAQDALLQTVGTLDRGYDALHDSVGSWANERRRLVSGISAQWQRLLQLAQQQVNLRLANGIVSDYYRALSSPVVLGELDRQTADGRQRVQDALYTRNSPLSAERALRIFGAVLDDIERNAPTLPITEPARTTAKLKLAAARDACAVYRARLNALTEAQRVVLAQRRRTRANAVLAVRAAQASAHCRDLGAATGVPTVESEQAYQQFLTQCAVGGAL